MSDRVSDPVSDAAALTRRCLDALAGSGARAGDLTAALSQSALLEALYGGRYLSRPVFLGAAEADRLHRDLLLVRQALVSLPERLHDGDVAAFARAVGLNDFQVAAVRSGAGREVTTLTRPDLYRERDGFGAFEINMGSAVGGIDTADMCRGYLRHPVLAAFAREHRLGFPDAMSEIVDLLFYETGLPREQYPTVAITDWPDHYRRLGPYLRALAPRWRAMGLDAHACHVGELTARNGRVWLRGRPVDVIYRVFLLEHLAAPGAPELVAPLLGAAARGEVAMFTPLDAEMYGSKAALAMLWAPANRPLLSADEAAAIGRVVPWTAMVLPGPAVLPGGRQGDLLEHAANCASDLVLKPALLHGGAGVVPGWHPSMTRSRWRDALASAMGGPFVIQRRVRPVPELFSDQDGDFAAWIVAWGAFTVGRVFGGCIAGPSRIRRTWARSTWTAARTWARP